MATASPGTAPLGLLGSPQVFPRGSWPGLGQAGQLLSEPLFGEGEGRGEKSVFVCLYDLNT